MSDSGVILTAAAPAFQVELGLTAARPPQGSRSQKVPSRRETQAILGLVLRAFMVVSRGAGRVGRMDLGAVSG
jgi:hypothetical protein